MPLKFNPNYKITAHITKNLMRIEAAKEKSLSLPLTPIVLSSLRQTAKLLTTHYSTMIEGNQLALEEVGKVITLKEHFPGRKKDEKEVLGYYAALAQLEKYEAQDVKISEEIIQTLHALAMSKGNTHIKPTQYRTGQNVIKDSKTNTVVYMPPEAKDVPMLMQNLVNWINENDDLPCPLVAAIAHYQFATIHPYYDGNGRTARLLTTLILHLGGYGLKGLYSLEEYYAKNLLAYYQALTVGPSHNYYFGRAEADITNWIDYFCQGAAISFEKVIIQMQKAQSLGQKDLSSLIRELGPKQRRVLDLFREYKVVTSKQIGEIFGLKARTTSKLCKNWVESKFLKIANPSKKNRTYRLAKKYELLLKNN
jgi:Fic family protein